MKKTAYIIALITGIVCAAVSARAETKVFLLGGQSNMAGLGGYDFPLPTPYSVPQPNVQFWNYGPGTQPDPTYGINYPGVGTGWVDLQSGFGHKPEHFGPEVTFGYTLNNIFPDDDIYLVKEGISSQDLAVHWNPDGTGNIYNIFKSRVDAAMQNLTDAGLSPTIAGMIWMQGESDALNPAYAPQYEANLTNLIQTVRSDFNTPDMPFVMGRILTMWGTMERKGRSIWASVSPANSARPSCRIASRKKILPNLIINMRWTLIQPIRRKLIWTPTAKQIG